MKIIRNRILISVLTCMAFIGPVMAQLTPHQAVPLMQKGINMGNTLEPEREGGWNNPPAQEYYFDMYKNAGFQTVRIPVRWDKHLLTSSPFTIDPSWLSRVETIVDWGLDRGLFIIINAHHDTWIKENYENPLIRERFDSLWSQISLKFKDKSDHLLFEVLNEPYGLTKQQNDDMHQRILAIIRKANPTRIVIIQGHNWGGSDELITTAIPDDDYIMGSFHSYDPYIFGLEGQGLWGSSSDYNNLKNKFIAVKTWSETNNIPIILGEFGALEKCEYNSRMKHYRAYVELSQLYGFVACAWDDGGDFKIANRSNQTWNEIKDILVRTTYYAPRNITIQLVQDTIIGITWKNAMPQTDSIFIQHRSQGNIFTQIGSLKSPSDSFLHLYPSANVNHLYRIIAKDSSGLTLYSQPVRIFMPPYTPKERGYFLNNPFAIPGIIEAEDFDTGGEGVTYHDATASNLGGTYRPSDAVDIYSRGEAADGFHIGSNLQGEWYEYTADIVQSGPYVVTFKIASLTGGGMFKLITDSDETHNLSAVSTESQVTTADITDTINLSEGIHILRFYVISTPYFNLDKMLFESVNPIVTTAQETEESIRIVQTAAGELWITSHAANPIHKICIFSLTGNLVDQFSGQGSSSLISTGSLPPGMYVIQFTTSRGSQTRKLLLH